MQAKQDLGFARALALAASLPFLTPVAAVGQSSSALQFGAEPMVFGPELLTFLEEPLKLSSAPIRPQIATTIEVALSAEILFDLDRAEICSTAQKALHEMANVIRGETDRPVSIQVYIEPSGKEVYNQTLSERRANAVKVWLVTKEGILVDRFTTASFGPRNSVASNRKPDVTRDPDGRDARPDF